MKNSFEMSQDTDHGMAYLRISSHPIASTEEYLPSVLVDLDQSRSVVGIEFLEVSDIDAQAFLKRFHVAAPYADNFETVLSSFIQNLQLS